MWRANRKRAVRKAIALSYFGVVVLTAADNILRPIPVGRNTHLSGYPVLIAALGGVASFGLNGVVIGGRRCDAVVCCRQGAAAQNALAMITGNEASAL